jgi:hypothetical protein
MVMWTCKLLDIPYEFKRVDAGKGETRLPSFLALNPNAVFPVLVDSKNGMYMCLLLHRFGSAQSLRRRALISSTRFGKADSFVHIILENIILYTSPINIVMCPVLSQSAA